MSRAFDVELDKPQFRRITWWLTRKTWVNLKVLRNIAIAALVLAAIDVAGDLDSGLNFKILVHGVIYGCTMIFVMAAAMSAAATLLTIRSIRRQYADCASASYTFDGEHFSVSSNGVDVRLEWRRIEWWTEAKGMLLIGRSSNCANPIPIDQITADTLDALRSALRAAQVKQV